LGCERACARSHPKMWGLTTGIPKEPGNLPVPQRAGEGIIHGMTKTSLVEALLKETCLISQASWAARVVYQETGWQVQESHRLTRKRRAGLSDFLENKSNTAWLGGALSGGRSRSRACSPGLDCRKVYLFPAFGGREWLFIVGAADALSKQGQQVWRLAAMLFCESSESENQTQELRQAVIELEETQQELRARIFAQREAEARLVQAAKLAAVGEMAAGIAHELNNPLTSVVGFTELSLDALPVNSPLHNDLDLVLREANRARSVVRRLLDFARQREVLRVRADINEIVDDVVTLTKHLLLTSGVELSLKLCKEMPWASIDRNQIKQVLINLVNNALYAMPQGGILSIETGQQQRHGKPFLLLIVRDNGVGISAEDLERIFEPFYTTRGEHGGTGLGLSVTYGIITEHGGTIEVESQVNAGSTFTVLFPLETPA
jgi:signal transduction histidine kinase